MAIYRPRRRAWRLGVASAVLGALVGLILGWAIWGRAERDPTEALANVRTSLTSAAGTLEVVEVEYRESVEDGDVVSTPEYEGARDALARSQERYLEVAGAVRTLDPDAAREIEDLYAELERLVGQLAPEDEVSQRVGELADLLVGVIGG
jgi:multidrug resistance efflux pump